MGTSGSPENNFSNKKSLDGASRYLLNNGCPHVGIVLEVSLTSGDRGCELEDLLADLLSHLLLKQSVVFCSLENEQAKNSAETQSFSSIVQEMRPYAGDKIELDISFRYAKYKDSNSEH